MKESRHIALGLVFMALALPGIFETVNYISLWIDNESIRALSIILTALRVLFVLACITPIVITLVAKKKMREGQSDRAAKLQRYNSRIMLMVCIAGLVVLLVMFVLYQLVLAGVMPMI